MKKIMIILLLITIPIGSLFMVWSYNVFSTYSLLSKDSYYQNKSRKLYRIGQAEYFSLIDKAFLTLGFPKKADVNFILQPSDLTTLNSNLPKSGGIEKRAYVLTDKSAIKGTLRYRGDMFYHWGYPKKSWRFKASKKNLYEGRQKVNFIIPKGNSLSNNHVSYELARLLGLLSPISYLTDISVNGVYDGVKLFVEQIDESFLRNNRRMPNDIYKGDNIAQKRFLSVGVSLFNNPSIWEKAAYNNHYEKSNLNPLEKMIEDLSQDKYEIYDLIDFAKMATFIDITGTHHHDTVHNWMLYYDSYYERMSPIIWDPVGWFGPGMVNAEVNLIHSKLLESLYHNGEFIRKKYAVLNNFYSKDSILFSKMLNQAALTAKKYISKNGYTFDMGRTYKDLLSSYDAVDNFVMSVDKRLSKVEEYFIGPSNKDDYRYSFSKNRIRLQVGGSKLIKKIILETKTPLKDLNKVYISILQNNEIKKFDVTSSVQYLTDRSLSIDIKLLPGIVANVGTLNQISTTYDIHLGSFVQNVSKVLFEIDNKQSEIVLVKKVNDIKMLSFHKRQSNILDTNIKSKPQFWEGIKRFSGFNIINDDITIAAGTKIILEEGATLKVLGKVTAIGTKESPITFEAKDKTKPWGAFALKDSKANDSIFKYCIFKDGSGDKGDLYEYTAMFSVHNVKNLLVESCEFYDSHKTDDMVHVIYSSSTFKNTTFVRALSDAIDIDISDVVIENSEFIDSGNDSIDLMTSNAIVTNSRFFNSKDKGISIGEGSNLLAINNMIRNSEIGMQSKDTSKAYIFNTSFIGNKKAVDAYHKNWQYAEGGTISLENSILENNIVNATVGKKSKVIFNNGVIDTPDNFDASSIEKGKIVLSKGNSIETDFNLDFFKNANIMPNNVITIP